MKALHVAAFTLLAVGGLNWGLSAFGYNLVNMIFGSWPQVETVVGLSAIVEVAVHKKNCRTCTGSSGAVM